MLLCFPDDLSISIITQWIHMVDLAHLDTAYCNRQQRPLLVQLLNSSDGRAIFHGTIQQTELIMEEDFEVRNERNDRNMSLSSMKFVHYCGWLAKRRIAVRKLHFSVYVRRSLYHCYVLQETEYLKTQFPDLIYSRVEDFCHPKSIAIYDNDLQYIILSGGSSSLVRLDLKGGSGLTDKGVNYIASGCSKLKELYIGDSYKITDLSLNYIANGCSLLEVLDISYCHLISDKGLKFIADGCLMLKSLNVEKCVKITEEGLLNSISRMSSLQSLNLYHCEEAVTDAAIESIVDGLPLLKWLNIGFCKRITDSSLVSIATHCSKLEVLHMWYNGDLITDVGLARIAEGCPILKSLNIGGCHKITEQGLINSISRLSLLQSLNLTKCAVTDAVIQNIVHILPQLQNLNIRCCRGITLTTIAAYCSQLEVLDLMACGTVISDSGLKSLAEGCTMLKSLEIGGWSSLTAEGLGHISRLASLQTLQLISCRQVDDDGIARLATGLSSLEYLVLGGGVITDRALESMATSSWKLKELGLNGDFTYEGVKALLYSNCCSRLKLLTGVAGIIPEANRIEIESSFPCIIKFENYTEFVDE